MLIISYKSKIEFTNFLDNNEIKYIKTIDNPNLDRRISDHPDLSLFKLDKDTLIVDESVYDYYKKNLNGIKLIKGQMAERKYPMDSIYNIVRFQNFYIHNDHTEKNIEKFYKDKDIRHIFVKQGYTRCSLIALNNSLLTSDYGIYKTLKDKLNIYLLKEEKIDLDGFDKGFLGGCFGFLDKKTVLFNGNIKKLASYDIIKNIVDKENLDLLYPDTNLLDTGSLIWI